MRELVKVYKVLSDESRLRVLNLLLERECCVCEVMQALDISQSKASRILSALYDAGILTLRRDGLWALYSIDRDGMDAYLKDIVEATTRAFKGNKVMIADRERLMRAERVGPSCVKKMRNADTIRQPQTQS
ncbi:MAG TPA: winged helix-turn-helix transcriptional regulator [Dehalococcoidia bacterium]|nr:winged helix-turn-helix transcriptional regulator [Dehalococcoidia bacterium]